MTADRQAAKILDSLECSWIEVYVGKSITVEGDVLLAVLEQFAQPVHPVGVHRIGVLRFERLELREIGSIVPAAVALNEMRYPICQLSVHLRAPCNSIE